MNSVSVIPSSAIPPAAPVAPAPSAVVTSVSVTTPPPSPLPAAVAPVPPLVEKPRQKARKQASSAARA